MKILGAIAGAVLSLTVMSAEAAVVYYSTSSDHARPNPGVLAGLGHTPTGFFAESDGGWSAGGVFAANPDAIILGEEYSYSLTSATTSALNAYVSGGGTLITYGSFDVTTGNRGLINTTFGFNISESLILPGGGCCSGQSDINAANAAGTSFDGGPADLVNGSSVAYTLNSSLPTGATSFYEAPFGPDMWSSVWAADFGAGSVIWMGFDFCCSIDSAGRAEWEDVLNRAINYQGGSPVPAPGALALLGFGLLGLGVRRRTE